MNSPYILGLDLGPNSIGWALLAVSTDESGSMEPTGFLDTTAAGHAPLGVRIFEAGLQNFDTAKEASLCEQRRRARAMRRTLQRRSARKRCIREVLVHAGLLPSNQSELDRVLGIDPYPLRAQVLDRALAPEQLGRLIYHLAQRRGFRSNRKQAGAAKERAELLQAIDQLSAAMQADGARTVGEFLARERERSLRVPAGQKMAPAQLGEVRIRNREFRRADFENQPRRTGRDMIKTEFELIISAQRAMGALENVTEQTIKKLDHFLFHQGAFELTPERIAKAPKRANLHRAPKLKNCPLEPGEKRCSRSSWIAQRFRILKEVNSLKVSTRGSSERWLDEQQRQAVIELLSEQKEVSFDKLRRALGLGSDAMFNLERGRRSGLDGNTLDALLAAGIGKARWRELPEDDRSAARRAVELEEDDQRLRRDLERLECKDASIEKLLAWEPEDGYVAYSAKALERIVPHLESGENEYEAIRREYPERGEGKVWDELPSLVTPGMPVELADLSNPIVRRGLVELRKVVNAIVREHGKPARIVVELAREMRQSGKERDAYNKDLAARRKLRAEAKAFIESHGEVANDRNIRRWLMWKEQGTYCLYSLKPIPQSLLFTSAVEEDHILPRSQSLEDSRPNMALVFATENQAKGNRTVAQWLGEGSDRLRAIIHHAESKITQGLPAGVVARLRQAEVDASDFLDRQLNDTKYMSRLASQYLLMLYPPELRVGEKAVRATRGGLTAELRRAWGLNQVLDHFCNARGEVVVDENKELGRKTRADHRHHAIDAVVIACTTRAMLQRFQSHLQRALPGAGRGALSGFRSPWPSLREDVAVAAKRIVVSHRPQLKVSGPLHEATYYGAVKGPDGQPVSGRFVTRKTLEQLTPALVAGEQIVDPVVRRLIQERLRKLGWDGSATAALPKDWWREELRGAHGVPIRRVRLHVSMGDPVKLGHRYAQAGNNHHIVFEPRASETDPLLARVERMFEFSKQRGPRAAAEPEGSASYPVGRTLGRKESVLVQPKGFESPVVCVVQKLSGGRTSSTTLDVCLRDTRDARPASEGNASPFARLASTQAMLNLGARKVQVDALGRIRPAHD